MQLNSAWWEDETREKPQRGASGSPFMKSITWCWEINDLSLSWHMTGFQPQIEKFARHVQPQRFAAMTVSIVIYEGFLKWWYPQIIHFNGVFHYKPSILGYHHLRKHPYINFPWRHACWDRKSCNGWAAPSIPAKEPSSWPTECSVMLWIKVWLKQIYRGVYHENIYHIYHLKISCA